MKKYKYECWRVAFKFQGQENYIVIKNTMRYWFADPFVLQRGDNYYIFAEMYDKLLTRGKIGYCVLNSKGKMVKRWKCVFDNKMHLSFPYLFPKNGSIYMLPESSRTKELFILEATCFPDKWQRTELLSQGKKYADTIFLNDNTLYTYDNFNSPYKSILLKKDGSLQLSELFFVEDLKLCLRPAGKVISQSENSFIIPLQNCDGDYGKSVFITKTMIDLDKKLINTSILDEISPSNIRLLNFKKRVSGVHTYNSDNNIYVIDIKTYEFSLIRFIGQVIRHIKNNGRKHV